MILRGLDLVLEDGVAVFDIMARLEALDLTLTEGVRWRGLISDLARLRGGWRPDAAALAKAPRLTAWAVSDAEAYGLIRLIGTVTGHPTVADHRLVQTSPLMALDTRSLLWARTASRFYRLIEPGLKT